MNTGHHSSDGATGVRLWPLTVVLVVALLLIIVGGTAFYLEQERGVREQARKELEAVARLKTSEVAQWRKDRLADAGRLTDSPSVRAFVMRWLDVPGPQETQDLTKLLASLRFGDRYSNVLLVDVEGNVLLAAEPTTLTRLQPSVRDALKAAVDSRESSLTDLHRPVGDPESHMDVLVPIYDGDTANSSALAAIVLRARAEDYLYPLIGTWPTASETAEIYLVREDDGTALILNDVRHQADTALSLRIPLSRTSVSAVQAVLGREGHYEGVDYRGEPVLSFLSRVEDSTWYVVADIDTDEALARWRTRSRLILALIVLSALLAFGVYAYVRARVRAQRLSEVLEAQSDRLIAQERLRATLSSVGDGVISTDLEGRIDFMNQVAQDLTGWPFEDAVGRLLDETLVLVDAQTRESVSSPAQRALREGHAVGLSNHVLLITRDGTERPIADSAAPIADERGEAIGAVIVFRDQTAAYRARTELETSERRHRLLFEHMIDGFALHEMIFDDRGHPADYRFLQVNAAFEQMTGLHAQDIIGRRVREVIPEVEHVWIERYGQVVATGAPAEFEDFSAGIGRYYRVTAYSPDKGQFACVITDITERKRAEDLAAIRTRLLETDPETSQAELMLSVLDEAGRFLTSPIGFFHTYDESTKTLALQAWSSTTATFCEAAVGEQHHDLDSAGVWADCIRQRRPVMHNDYASLPNKKGLPEGHSPLAREVVVPIFRAGRVEAVLGVGNSPNPYSQADVRALVQLGDIAWELVQRKRAEAALREAERRVLTLSDNIPDGYVYQLAMDHDGGDKRFLHISAGVERVHGLTPGQVLEDPSVLYGQTAQADQPAVAEAEAEALREMKSFHARVRAIMPDGTTKWLRIASVPRRTDNGEILWDGLTIDVTQRVAAEQELQQRTDELVRSNAELEKFAYIASHDLQEPLRMVASYTQLLQRRYAGQLGADADEFIEFAVDGATRMQDLINELLAYSRVGSQGAPFAKTDLGEVLARVLKVLEAPLEEIGAQVEAEAMPTVECDATQVGQVFQNLLSNAIKFRSGDRPLAIRVSAEQQGEEWLFSVADNGMGIESRYFERIFVIFQRLEDRSEYPGTGMGLAICKRIVERHGGRIWVESTPGEGSTFYFTLLRHKEDQDDG